MTSINIVKLDDNIIDFIEAQARVPLTGRTQNPDIQQAGLGTARHGEARRGSGVGQLDKEQPSSFGVDSVKVCADSSNAGADSVNVNADFLNVKADFV